MIMSLMSDFLIFFSQSSPCYSNYNIKFYICLFPFKVIRQKGRMKVSLLKKK